MHSNTRPGNVADASVDDLLDRVGQSIDDGTVPVDIFNDPRIHELELKRIYGRCWVFVGHASEIPEPGDYVLRYIGEDQFILVRDEHGEIRLLLNSCRHRGSAVCRADRGNASHFRCPYHAWVFKNSGEWNGAPHRRNAYRDLDPAEWSLLSAPNVDSIQGLIFASLDPEAPTLREYLGDMVWYLDAYLGVDPMGTSVVGDPHRWRVPANWKSGAENFIGDAYHVPSLHRSIEDIGAFPEIDAVIGAEFHVDVGKGQGMIMTPGGLPRPPWGILDCPPEVTEHFRLDGLLPEQREMIEHNTMVTFTIFPNLSYIASPIVAEPGSDPTAFMALRQWQPRGPGQMDIWNWPMVWTSAPEEFKKASYRGGVTYFSPSGMVEQDDTVAWAGAPVAGKSAFARANEMSFNLQLGHNGMSDYGYRTDWAGPGRASTSIYGERQQLDYYSRWLEEVTKP